MVWQGILLKFLCVTRGQTEARRTARGKTGLSFSELTSRIFRVSYCLGKGFLQSPHSMQADLSRDKWGLIQGNGKSSSQLKGGVGCYSLSEIPHTVHSLQVTLTALLPLQVLPSWPSAPCLSSPPNTLGLTGVPWEVPCIHFSASPPRLYDHAVPSAGK